MRGENSLAIVTAPSAAAETGGSATALAPGFRFHPTDEELVSYYLKRKVTNKPVRFNAIAEVDIYKHEPWDLSDKSRLKTRDQEWYFFSLLDKKYGNGGRMNRATNQGYWKATGKDREVRHNDQLMGMKKTLVFHNGRAPDGLRTNWVMHEYRLVEEELERIGTLQNNIGPPNGNRYAPFIEAEWDDGSAALVPGIDIGDDSVASEKALVESNGVQRSVLSRVEIQNADEEAPANDKVRRELLNERTYDCPPLPPGKIERLDNGPPLCLKKPHVPPPIYETANLDSMVPPGCMKLISDLQNEIRKISAERETLKLEMMSAQAMINILQSKVDFLSKENEDLKRNNRELRGGSVGSCSHP
ncbi:hypothetical protein GOBAR_DD16906 [Gossypium barbadense]|nr:hypothetical protein GOBAR_DD16906 [Gossypium barbadense]